MAGVLVIDIPWRSNEQVGSFAAHAAHTRKCPSAQTSHFSTGFSTSAPSSCGAHNATAAKFPNTLQVEIAGVPSAVLNFPDNATVGDARRALSLATDTAIDQVRLEAAGADILADDLTLSGCSSLRLSASYSSARSNTLALLLQRTAAKAARRQSSAGDPTGSPQDTIPIRLGWTVLDWSRTWVMPVLFQTVHLDQTTVERSGFENSKDGFYYHGLGVAVQLKTLEITAVKSGLAEAWNLLHPNAPIAVGDRIMEVNGVRDADTVIRKVLARRQPLKLVLSKRDTQTPPPPSQWNVGGFTVPLACDAIELYVAGATGVAHSAAVSDAGGEAGEAGEAIAPRHVEMRHARFRLHWSGEGWIPRGEPWEYRELAMAQ